MIAPEQITGSPHYRSKLIDFGSHWDLSLPRLLRPLLQRSLESLFAINRLNAAYRKSTSVPARPSFFAAWLDTLQITYTLCGVSLAQIPRTGPVVITANHPFGGLEGIILGDILTRIRPDVKILGNYVKPRKPFRHKRRYGVNRKLLFSCLCTIDDVANIIRQVERDQKGVPILLRHYLKLNASFVDFNIDEEFSNALDGLMVVDLTKTPERYLMRFMGKEGYRNFQEYHTGKEDKDSLPCAV